ncbi:ImmA/IrrE family metallo-endopeptidase [Lysobacter auxotrophicus]|uniref:ImmA/IrrE family metallo-endopeptidase n=1 Tax=Lysobacter auxotrophicus TaxID=2992573 RepID=A0ABN6UF53_9GAMM|nr:ImmA/IrrE family metallo-endopeptidase [Lysobacter auxotrophicus]
MSRFIRGDRRANVEALELSRDVLDWAAERAGQTLHSFAESVAKREKDRERIAEGRLTVPQAEKLAKKARIPFGYLFLAEPPEITRPSIPDLRQVQDAQPLSEDFYETLEDVFAKQSWLIEHLTEAGAGELPFVGRFAADAKRNADDIAADMRRELGITDDDRRKSPDAATYFSALSAKAEAKGVLVFKTSYVKSNTRRPISEKEFRGFAVAHKLVPLVFINGRDAEVAAVFTLMHELAHIWLGVTGVSDVTPSRFGNPTERLCNRVAANVLVPVNAFLERWAGPQDVEKLAKYFRVSKLVIARRAFDSKLVDQAFYDEIAANTQRVKSSGKPTALVTIPIRNSKKFTRTIVASAMSGQTLLRDAASLLNVKPDTVVALAKGRAEHD